MKERGVTADALATTLGVKTNQPYRWMKNQMPERPMLERIAVALDTTWQWLLVGDAVSTAPAPSAGADSDLLAHLKGHPDLLGHVLSQVSHLNQIPALMKQIAELLARIKDLEAQLSAAQLEASADPVEVVRARHGARAARDVARAIAAAERAQGKAGRAS